MSWGISYGYASGDLTDEGEKTVNELAEKAEKGEQTMEVTEQVLVAVAYADAVIGSGAVGDPQGKFRVVIGGHANPEHKPSDGWANDALNINIYQLDADSE